MLFDRFNRAITYLRVSVTDRCNFRCVYCMPPEGVNWRPHSEILTYEEITNLVEAAARLGITHVRITGGEPLVRKDLPSLVRAITDIPGIEEVSLTTNGYLLENMIPGLVEAGLKRVNISLDTLDSEKFRQMTRFGSFEQVWNGILAAEAAGLTPIKINTVVIRGVNDDELINIARLTLTKSWQVRFIEFMPLVNEQEWGPGFPSADQRYISVQEIHQRLKPLNLAEMEDQNGNGPARVFHIPGGKGSIGFISPIGEHFCEQCNRLRLTADGNLRPCLINEAEIPVREVLRSGGDLLAKIQQAVDLKPQGHDLLGSGFQSDRKMAQIGG